MKPETSICRGDGTPSRKNSRRFRKFLWQTNWTDKSAKRNHIRNESTWKLWEIRSLKISKEWWQKCGKTKIVPGVSGIWLRIICSTLTIRHTYNALPKKKQRLKTSIHSQEILRRKSNSWWKNSAQPRLRKASFKQESSKLSSNHLFVRTPVSKRTPRAVTWVLRIKYSINDAAPFD